MNILSKDPQTIKLDHEEATIDSSSDKEKTPLRFFINCFLNSTAIGKRKTKKNKTNGTSARISGIEPVHMTSTLKPMGEKSFADDTVLHRICGGFFGSGWERRQLYFGKQDGYSQNDLLHYITANKIIYRLAENPLDETAKQAMENAAHATVTGVGLLFLAKSKSPCIPVNIINLGDVIIVKIHKCGFKIETKLMGNYEFSFTGIEKAVYWKREIETRVEQSKFIRSSVQESKKYKEYVAGFKNDI